MECDENSWQEKQKFHTDQKLTRNIEKIRVRF